MIKGPAASSAHTECRVFLDGDPLYYDRWKGECLSSWSATACETVRVARVTVKMIETLHQIDELYRRDSNLGGTVTLAVAGTHVFTSSSSGIPDMTGKTSNGVIDSYQMWLASGHTVKRENGAWVSDMDSVRGTAQPKAIEVCLNHLFTHVDFNTGTLGVATMAAICPESAWFLTSGGGMTLPTDGGYGSRINNAGFTTTLSRGM